MTTLHNFFSVYIMNILKVPATGFENKGCFPATLIATCHDSTRLSQQVTYLVIFIFLSYGNYFFFPHPEFRIPPTRFELFAGTSCFYLHQRLTNPFIVFSLVHIASFLKERFADKQRFLRADDIFEGNTCDFDSLPTCIVF